MVGLGGKQMYGLGGESMVDLLAPRLDCVTRLEYGSAEDGITGEAGYSTGRMKSGLKRWRGGYSDEARFRFAPVFGARPGANGREDPRRRGPRYDWR